MSRRASLKSGKILRFRAVSPETTWSSYDTAKIGSHLEGIEKIMKKKLVLLFRRIVPSRRNGVANRGNNTRDSQPQFEWPYVMLGPTYRVRC